MDINLFNYDLDEKLIAQKPLKNRSDSKLLILDKDEETIKHEKFCNIIDYLDSNDVLVLNNTKVLPSRLIGYKKDTNAKIEVLLLNDKGNDIWECLSRPQKRIKKGTIICFEDKLEAECTEVLDDGITMFKMHYDGIFLELLDYIGAMPLPPYIHASLKEKDRYNTVYAKTAGSAAAPTAGLHFTKELLSSIEMKGITICYVTLNVGLGTFRPVAESNIETHHMHSELYEINEETARTLNEAKNNGKRIICVGTTSLRTLEANIQKYGKFKSTCEETDIFIYPPFRFKSTDCLITNFHLPKSTLVMLVSAFSNRELILNAYTEAQSLKYRFFSFGDAMFITNNKNGAKKTLKYKEMISSINKEKEYFKDDFFKLYKGNSNILVSAPHAYKHLRNGKTKANEYNTSNIVRILHKLTNCNIIYTYNSINGDPNYEDNNLYRKVLKDFIIENNIKYFIDVHGIEKGYDYDIEIGTNNLSNVKGDKELVNNIENIIKNNITDKVVIDHKYKGGEKTLSYFVSNNTNAKSIQVEINKKLRKMKKIPKVFNKTINALVKIIELFERCD